MDNQSGVTFGYIDKILRLADDEVARLRDKDLKILLRHKKHYLVLDLDNTLLNSTWFSDVTQDEGYLMNTDDLMQGFPVLLGVIRECGNIETNEMKFLNLDDPMGICNRCWDKWDRLDQWYETTSAPSNM